MRKDKCHYISKKAKFEIGKINSWLAAGWKWLFIGLGLFQDKGYRKNRTNLMHFYFFRESSFKSYEYTRS
jgi:hypothetical protein